MVTQENYEDWVETANGKGMVLLFTDRKSTAPLFKSLSKFYKDKLVFGEVKKEPELLKKFGIEKSPALIVISDPYEFKGETYNTTDIKID